MNRKQKLLALTECALMLALATALSFVKISPGMFGGSVTPLSMFPVMFISFRYGVKRGLACGFVYSLIQLWQGSGNLAYAPTGLGVVGCIFLDYIFPFTLLGIAGVFYKKEGKNWQKILTAVLGVVLACVLRFGFHFLAGVLIWSEIAKNASFFDYFKSIGIWTYSFVYNLSYLGPDAALVIIASPSIPFIEKVLKKVK